MAKVKVKQLQVNCKTGKSKIVEVDREAFVESVEVKGLDFQKLKQKLVSKGIIADESEVE